MAVLVVALLTHNVGLLAYNQATFDERHRWTLQHETLSEIAAHGNPNVREDIGIYYFLREHIAGARIEVPEALSRFRWRLERTARLVAEPTSESRALSRKVALELIERASFERRLSGYPIHFLFADGATRYVMAHTPDLRTLFVLPEAVWSSIPGSERR